MTGKPTTHAEYLAALRDDQRTALEQLRAAIREVAPDAEECISYGIPAFRQNGMLVGYGATSRHCAFYLMSAATVANHLEDLQGYDTSKGTLRFQPGKPLPTALVQKLVQARIQENCS
jgi:uncharacterized protein YdhG (YjbR/CyaY superfamily)